MTDTLKLSLGEGRTQVRVLASFLNNDPVICFYNDSPHVGAVAVGEFDHKENRASVSVLTRLGHKDDAIAHEAAYLISKATKKPVCVVAGVHLDDITLPEIEAILVNARGLVAQIISRLAG